MRRVGPTGGCPQLRWGDAASAPTPDPRRALSSDLPRQPAPAHLPRRPRPASVPRARRICGTPARLALRVVLPDAEPLPPAGRDTRGRSVGRDAGDQLAPCDVVQLALRARRAPVPGPLQECVGRERDTPPRALAVHRAEPRPRGPVREPGGVGLEQLPADAGCRSETW